MPPRTSAPLKIGAGDLVSDGLVPLAALPVKAAPPVKPQLPPPHPPKEWPSAAVLAKAGKQYRDADRVENAQGKVNDKVGEFGVDDV